MRTQRAIAARRGACIEWFSDCSNHGGAICTRPEIRSQASCQHCAYNITVGSREFTLALPPLSDRAGCNAWCAKKVVPAPAAPGRDGCEDAALTPCGLPGVVWSELTVRATERTRANSIRAV